MNRRKDQREHIYQFLSCDKINYYLRKLLLYNLHHESVMSVPKTVASQPAAMIRSA